MNKKNAGVFKEIAEAFQIDASMTNRHQETNPSNHRRAVEDLLEIKRYRELHDEYSEL